MSRKQGGVAIEGGLHHSGVWNDAFGDRRYRHSRSTTVIPHLGSKSTLVWRKEESSHLPTKVMPALVKQPQDVKVKPKTSMSLPSAASLPHSWRSPATDSKEQISQATDRAYRHTYGDRNSAPFDIQLSKDFPKIAQKPNIENPLDLPVGTSDRQPTLPQEIVSKVYSRLHHEEVPQDKNCVYVIKNMHRTTPANKPVHLPTVIPFYNIQLVKSVSKVLTEELFSNTQEDPEESVIRRPMRAERKYYTQISGKLLRSRKKLAFHNDSTVDSFHNSSISRAFKSAEAYNKLLAMKHADKVESASQSDACPPSSSKLRHAHKVTFKCDSEERKVTSADAQPAASVQELSSQRDAPNQHVTAVKVSRRETAKEMDQV